MGNETTIKTTYFSTEKIASIVSQSVKEAKAVIEQQGLYMTTTKAEDEIGYDTVEFSFAVPVELSYEIANRLPMPAHYKHYNQTATNQYFEDGVKVGEAPRWSKRKILNMEISINHDYGSVKVAGSIPKFLYGSNLHLSQPNNIPVFISTLSGIMGIGADALRQAIVKRIDTTANMLMDNSVESCLMSLDDANGFYRHKEWRPLNSVYWCNSRTKMERASDIIFAYNKLDEMRNKKTEIPLEYADKNFLRIEERLTTAAIKKVFAQHLTLSQLGTDTVFSKLRNRLLNTIKQMRKTDVTNIDKFKSSGITTASDVTKLYIGLAVSTLNKNVPIEIAVTMSPLNLKQKSSAKKQLKSHLTVVDMCNSTGEIDRKIAALSNTIP